MSTNLILLITNLTPVTKKSVIWAVGWYAVLTGVIYTGLNPIAIYPVVAVTAIETCEGGKAKIYHAEAQVIIMSRVGNPECSVIVRTSTAPAVLAQIGSLCVIPANEQHGMTSTV